MNLWMRVWKVFIKLWRTSEENESQKPLYHIWYQSVVWFYWWPGICLVYWAYIQTYQPYDKDWIKEKIYMLFQQAQQAGTFGSIMGTGVGLEHRCGQCALVQVLCYSYPVAILVYASQSWMYEMKGDGLVQSETPFDHTPHFLLIHLYDDLDGSWFLSANVGSSPSNCSYLPDMY